MDNRSSEYQQLCEDYQRVEQAIRYIESHFQQQPRLSEIAAHLHLSEYHFQRLFNRWVGVSPKRYLQFLTKEYVKELLPARSLLETAYSAGLSGPSRLHDLFVTWEAVTPGEYKLRGAGLTITYAILPSPFGMCLLAITRRGVCNLAFVQPENQTQLLEHFRWRWQEAELVQDDASVAPYMERVFTAYLRKDPGRLDLYVRGTNFQIKVWEALLTIEPGTVVCYHDIAVQIGMPAAARAVGNAVANNPLAVIIPCHRVINRNGGFGGYRWGIERKKALLAWEMSRAGLNP
jgi:AraC family transcriptional regulator of adaptative response/methylated-DNA-[protein]-cysteine methyltransferase